MQSIFVLVPMITIIGCYSAIYLKLKKASQEMESLSISNSTVRNHESRILKISFVISICFVAFVFPNYILNLIQKVHPNLPSEVWGNLDCLLYVLMGANSIVNPFIYFFMSKTYRKTFFDLFQRRRMRN